MKTLSSCSFPHLILTLTVFLSLVGVGCSDSSSENAAEELFEPGPFAVGFRELSVTYRAAGTGEPRELPLQVWYPASADTDAEPVVYRVGGIVAVPSPTALDAPEVTEDADLPFVVYSHGNAGVGLLAYPYGELMASHGWMMVAPDHTGNTALDAVLGSSDPRALAVLNRPNDITAIIDEFESGLEEDALEGKADTSQVYVFGHSFGGFTTFAVGGADLDFDAFSAGCEGTTSESCDLLADPDIEAAYREGFADPRVVAIAPQAPSLTSIPQSELAALEVPSMLMSGRLDQTTTQEQSAEPAWAGLDSPDDIWVEMPTGAHFTFISICDDLSEEEIAIFQPDAGDDGCGEEFLPTSEAVPVLAAYVLGFGRLHVLGETEWQSVLTGSPLGNGFVITLP